MPTRIATALCAWALWLAGAAHAQGDEGALHIESRDLAGGGKQFIAHNRSLAPLSLKFEILGSGIRSTPRSPIVAVLPPHSRSELATVRGERPGTSYRFSYRSSYREGTLDAQHDARYRLPFPQGFAFYISQASDGPLRTHTTPDSHHAVDFAIPESALIVAARGGTVIEVVDHHTIGTLDRFYLTRANRVRIVHADGTIASYAHLAPNSRLVEVGDVVAAGDLLARSGHTGYSSAPHLHFSVNHNRLDRSGTLVSESLPITFYTGVPASTFAPTTGLLAQADYGEATTLARAESAEPIAMPDSVPTHAPASTPTPVQKAETPYLPPTPPPVTVATRPPPPPKSDASPWIWLSLGALLLAWHISRPRPQRRSQRR